MTRAASDSGRRRRLDFLRVAAGARLDELREERADEVGGLISGVRVL